ncbi:MAG TPA: HAMP domain-containing sensor histidine kinase [Acetobacteraceae bacterium]|nr:HAMP domain-containing sensor histidine kinase [Acetobacteraceae bacterium]
MTFDTGRSSGWRRLIRTSSFRLTLLYAGLFAFSVLVLLAAMLWWGTSFIAREIDTTVANELSEVQSDAARPGSGGMRAVVAAMTTESPGMRYLLETADGHVLAGNMPALPARVGVQTWQPEVDGLKRLLPLQRGVRGRMVRTTNGDYLFVGLNTFELNEMREMVTRAFFWVLVATLLLAVTVGVVISQGLLNRVEAISRTSREIVAGDLGRRIALRGSDDEFDHLAVSLNAMLDRIQALMEGLNQVSSDIAHDLRTPLTRLRQRLELARLRGDSVETLHHALDAAMTDVDAILETFAALLRIAQLEAGTQPAEFAALDLSLLLEELLEFYRPVAEEQGHAVAGAIEPAVRVRGDAELLTQMFANLIENALHHTPVGTSITVECRRSDNAVLVEVRDTGPGIPTELRKKVFQRFFRLERSRTTPGTGLGLSLVSAVASLHRVSVELADNQPGLIVRLTIPSGG